MASIRRTLSPLSGRFYRIGSNPPIAAHAASQKVSGKATFSPIRKFIGGLFLLTHYPRKRGHLKRSLFTCLIFFFLGILLGMAPFSNDYLSDLQNRETVEFLPRSSDVGGGELGLVRELKKTTAMSSSSTETKQQISDSLPDKLLIVVTPTYNRALQAYYLNRLGQVLRLLRPPLLWIVVEMNAASMETSMILRNMGVVYRHLVCDKKSTSVKDRGVHQRNTAIEHIEMHKLDGIVYFADDDNVYTLELLQSMRRIRRFGTWPVGMMAQSKNKAVLEGPICSGNEVIGWHTNEKSKRLRRFHVDMSGFAFNSTILWDSKRWHRPTSAPIRQLDTVKEGFQETSFIEQIVEDETQMEGVPGGCDRIMNWHLHLETHEMLYPTGWMLQQNAVDTVTGHLHSSNE